MANHRETKRQKRHRECERKATYDSQWLATAIAKNLRSRGGHFRLIEPYRCRWCGLWHVGHGSTGPSPVKA